MSISVASISLAPQGLRNLQAATDSAEDVLAFAVPAGHAVGFGASSTIMDSRSPLMTAALNLSIGVALTR